MDSKQQYKVIGLMSGTSLDGIDIAYCTFTKTETWKYTIEHAETVPYSKPWYQRLKEAHTFSGEDLTALDVGYGNFLGDCCRKFAHRNKIKKIDFISSHGHTVFHQPARGFTLQIGNGNAIHAVTNLPVVFDFRSLDVQRGGQGAPLVPVGDRLLFGEYDVCLNVGGIANLSREQHAQRIAFDVAYVNMGLNYLASQINKKYDRNGQLSARGEINQELLEQLERTYNKIRRSRPSLGREFFEKNIQPLLDKKDISLYDRMRTFTESCAHEITRAIFQPGKNPSVLCTGGGAFNSFLIYRLLEICGDHETFIIPDEQTVKFKEALIFAFLGVLRVRGEINCLSSVTGAIDNSSAGVMVGF
jgi:anhydro-N-acetylmuramic acid kinase